MISIIRDKSFMLNCPNRSISSVTVVLFLLFSSCASDLNRIQLAEEYANLGGAYIKLRDMDGAISYLKRSLELDDEDTETQFNLAFALLSNKEIAEAQKILENLYTIDPSNSRVLELQAVAFQSANQFTAALNKYKEILAIQPENSLARYNSAILLWDIDKPTLAISELKTLVEFYPNDKEALYNLGVFLFESGELSEATVILSQYLEKEPNDVDALLAFARVENRRSKYLESLSAFDMAINLLSEQDSRLREIYFERATILLTKVEDPKAGLIALEKSFSKGFRDNKKISTLLEIDGLLEKQKVYDLIIYYNLDITTEDT